MKTLLVAQWFLLACLSKNIAASEILPEGTSTPKLYSDYLNAQARFYLSPTTTIPIPFKAVLGTRWDKNDTKYNASLSAEENYSNTTTRKAKKVLERNSRMTPESGSDIGITNDLETEKTIDGILDLLQQAINTFPFEDHQDTESKDSKTIAKKIWIRYGMMTKQLKVKILHKFFPILLKSDIGVNVSAKCQGILFRFLQDFVEQKLWTAKMMDAVGKLESGLLQGTLMSFGAFDECLDVVLHNDDNANEILTKGQYCMVRTKFPLPPRPKNIKFRQPIFNFTNTPLQGTALEQLSESAYFFYDNYFKLGICVPSLCTEHDMNNLVISVGKKLELPMDVAYCIEKEDWKFSNLQITVMSAFGVLVACVAAGTIADAVLCYRSKAQNEQQAENKERGSILKILLCFSGIGNTQLLLVTETQSSLGTLHGIKVLSIAWICLSHTYSLAYYTAFSQASYFLDFFKQLPYQGIMNGFLIVDTFFLLGGMIVYYSTIKHLQKFNEGFSYVKVIIHRYIRLIPSMVGIIGLVFLWPLMGSGPIWKEIVDSQVSQCERSWWHHLVLIANWFKVPDICLLHFWYVSADMQIFLLIIVPVVLVYRRPLAGLLCLVSFAVFGIVISTSIIYWNNLPPSVIFADADRRKLQKESELIHLLPFSHIPIYCIGIGLGYAIVNYGKIKINKVLFWCLTATGCLTVLWWPFNWNNGAEVQLISGLVYASISKSVWALGISWLIYACVTGRGGFVNAVLSWKALIPLSRLSYMIYLAHVVVIWFRNALLRDHITVGHYTMICSFLLNMVISIVVAYFGFLLFEAPVARIEKLLTTSKKDSKVSNQVPSESKNSESPGNAILNIFVCKEQVWHPDPDRKLTNEKRESFYYNF